MPTNPNDPTVVSGAPVARAVNRLGRYSLKQRLGVGGMAEVYLAEQDGPQSFRKKVVVKRILPSLAADAQFVAMFVREAQVAARLSHNNVVQIYELGEAEVDGQTEYFIAMEYIDGLTLQRLATASWNAGKAVPIDVVVRTTADAARGLHAAHTLADDNGKPINLVHRDISPDNLMVSKDGVTKVLDFGIAKGDLGGPKTRTGNLRGKVPYMSPEQITGQDLDGRCDLWALGVSIYWLLCGERPFDRGTDFHTMQAVLYDQPKPPTELNPAIPKKLEKLILDLLAKDRGARPANAALVADELEEFASAGSGAGRRTTVRFVEEHLAHTAAQGNPLSEHGESTSNTRPVAPSKGNLPSTEVHDFPSEERPVPLPQKLPSSAQRISLSDIHSGPVSPPEGSIPRKVTGIEAASSGPPPIVTEDAYKPVPAGPSSSSVAAAASSVAAASAAAAAGSAESAVPLHKPPSAATPATTPQPPPQPPAVVANKGGNHPVVDMLAPPRQGISVGAIVAIGVVSVAVLCAVAFVGYRFVVAQQDDKKPHPHKGDAGVVVAHADAGTQASADAGINVLAAVPDAGTRAADAGTKIATVVDAGAKIASAEDAGVWAPFADAGTKVVEKADAGSKVVIKHVDKGPPAGMMFMQLKAGPSATWSLENHTAVGKGNVAKAVVPDGTKKLLVRDKMQPKADTVVTCDGAVCDYSELCTGYFVVHAAPGTVITIGQFQVTGDKQLEAQPGTYEVRIVPVNGRVTNKTVKLQAGKTIPLNG